MVNQVIKLTGSSNHNKCAKADVKDPKAWCYTTDPNKRWEHCNQLCTSPENPDDSENSDDSVAGTRIRDIPEQVPQVDPRSKYDQNGNCIKNCRSRGLSAGIEQCGRNECQKPKPHLVQIYSWFEPSLESYNQFGIPITGESSTEFSKDEVFPDFKSKYVIFIILIR